MNREKNVDEMLSASWDQLLARDLASEVRCFSDDKRYLIPELKKFFAVKGYTASQAAIVLENARLYADLQQENSERKRAEEALRRSEQRFRDYVATASDWLWETGPDHLFTYISEQLSAVGIDPAGLIGKRRFDAASDQETETRKWREHMAGLELHEPFRNFEYIRGRRPLCSIHCWR
jgi:PAS domain-containing protein